MIEIEDEGSGLLFSGWRLQEVNPKAPDFYGVINVGGEQYNIALWEKQFKSGDGFSVRVSPIDYGNTNEDEDEDDEPVPVKKSSRKIPAKKVSRKEPVKKVSSSRASFRKPRR